MRLVEGLQLGIGGGGAAAGERGRHEADRARALLDHQPGIGADQAFGQRHRAGGGHIDHAAEEVAAEIGAHLRVGQVLLRERGEVGFLVELAVDAAEGGDRGDRSIDLATARTEAQLLTELFQRGGADHLVDDRGETALPNEGRHIEAGLLLGILAVLGADPLIHVGRGDRLAADGRDRRTVRPAAHRAAGHLMREDAGDDECQHDQREQAQRQLGGEGLAEKSDHASPRYGSDAPPLEGTGPPIKRAAGGRDRWALSSAAI